MDQLSQTRGKRVHPWVAGQGCKPWTLNSTKATYRALKPFSEPQNKWSPQDSFVTPSELKGRSSCLNPICGSIEEHFSAKGYSLADLYSKPPAALFTPPLVLINQGFTGATFFDFAVRFQDSLQSIAGQERIPIELIFLAAYLRSRLARYFAFHTSANIGVERDKVHSR